MEPTIENAPTIIITNTSTTTNKDTPDNSNPVEAPQSKSKERRVLKRYYYITLLSESVLTLCV